MRVSKYAIAAVLIGVVWGDLLGSPLFFYAAILEMCDAQIGRRWLNVAFMSHTGCVKF